MTATHSIKRGLDITGKKFNRLLAVEKTDLRSANHVVWKFLCDCGNIHFAAATEVKRGQTKSCGCYHIDFLRRTMTTHGATKNSRATSTYASWIGMLSRCLDRNFTNYHRYGGRGIAVCERWMAFENFAEDLGERPAGHSIDRIDNDGNYEPSNCRWATPAQQNSNRSSNVNLEIDGVRKNIKEWSQQSGRDQSTIGKRIKRGLSPHDAVFGPMRRVGGSKNPAA